MSGLLASPLWGIILSILAFELGLWIYRRTKITFFNPLLIAILVVLAVLVVFDIDFEQYNAGGQYLTFFLGPATVILAVPLYHQRKLLKRNLVPILGSVVAGCITAITSVYLLARAFGLEEAVGVSMVPKSVTTPIGIELSAQLGGVPSITVAMIVLTGIFGAVAGPAFCRLFGITDPVAVGLSMGTASHALGTTRAMELGETQGAMSGLSIGLAGLITVFLAPLLLGFL